MFKVSVKEYIKDFHVLYNKKTNNLKQLRLLQSFNGLLIVCYSNAIKKLFFFFSINFRKLNSENKMNYSFKLCKFLQNLYVKIYSKC